MDSFLNFGFWILACTKNLQTYRDNQIFYEKRLGGGGLKPNVLEKTRNLDA